MHDRLEIAPRGRVGKDDVAERLAIEVPVGRKNAIAEPRADGRGPFGTGRDDLAGDSVGIDQRNPVGREPIGHVALTRGDTARQRYAQHQGRSSTAGAVVMSSSAGVSRSSMNVFQSWQ
jgi:hypothetical protein